MTDHPFKPDLQDGSNRCTTCGEVHASPPSGSETGELLRKLFDNYLGALDGGQKQAVAKAALEAALWDNKAGIVASLTRAQPQADGEAVAWRLVSKNKLLNGLITTRADQADHWREDSSLEVQPLYARPTPSETACDQVRGELAYSATNQIAACRCGSFPRLYGDGARPDDGYRSLWCQTCMEHVTEMMPSEREVIDYWNNLREQEHATPPTGSSPVKRDELPNASNPGSGLTVRDSGASE